MGLFNFEIFKKKDAWGYSTDSFKFTLPELPVIKEMKGKEWIYYGEDNLYPQNLKKIIMQSPTQGAIIKGKAGMMSGDAVLINGATSVGESNKMIEALPLSVQSEYKKFVTNINAQSDLEEIISLVSADYQTFGAFAIEVVWSLDFSKIVTLKYVDVSDIRCGKLVNGNVEKYFYSRDWSQCTKDGYAPQPMAAFDTKNKNDYNQLIYAKNGNLEYYGEPSYIQGISYVELEGKIANYHLSNISNAFAPSMAMKFYQKPAPEEQRTLVRQIERTYSGSGNAGRAMIFFSDGKELAPDISPIPASDLHHQYIAVNDLTVQNILTANQVTSPLLFGISTPGKLGGGAELDTAYQIFNSSVIEPDRKKLEKVFNKILEINNVPVTVAILPFNPLSDNTIADTGNTVVNALNSLTPLLAAKVLDSMSAEEIRAMVGLPALQTAETNTVTTKQ